MLLKLWTDKSQSALTHSCPFLSLSNVSSPSLCLYCISPIQLALYEKALIESGEEHTGDGVILAGCLHSGF